VDSVQLHHLPCESATAAKKARRSAAWPRTRPTQPNFGEFSPRRRWLGRSGCLDMGGGACLRLRGNKGTASHICAPRLFPLLKYTRNTNMIGFDRGEAASRLSSSSISPHPSMRRPRQLPTPNGAIPNQDTRRPDPLRSQIPKTMEQLSMPTLLSPCFGRACRLAFGTTTVRGPRVIR
jgi:hypothetical protein